MQNLLKKINNLGWFVGEFDLQINIKRSFEGYSGKATEDWETQYSIKSKGLNDGEIFPIINEKSKSYETFEDFIKRIEQKYNL